MVEVLVLGPVRVRRDGIDLPTPGPRERAVLAALALAGPTGIDTDRLVDRVWGDDVPRTATRTLQAYLSRLRALLGADALITEAGRHRLVADVDLWRWDALRATARDNPTAARAALDEALSLWRDPVPATDAPLDGGAGELTAVTQSRLDTAEQLLAHLDDAAVVTAAEKVLTEDPLRERAWVALATALYRLGRQGDALAAVRRARAVLADELGLDPSPDLVRLERDLLQQRIEPRGRGVPIPVPLTPLVGRDALCDDVATRLATARLVTLVGVGGIGKTRLASAAATEVATRTGTTAWFAALAGATTARAVEDTLVTAVGADTDLDDVVASYAARFAATGGLVVVDNCEHVVTVASDLLPRILAACPQLRVLATSRTPLGINGEVLVDVPPLPAHEAALDLFLARAGEVTSVEAWADAELADAAAICTAVDGLPLAIELVARRLRFEPVRQVHRDLQLLETQARGGEPRHRTMTAALDSSVELLDADARRAYGRLGVLRGPVPADLAAAIVGGRARVEALVDASLLVASGGDVRMFEPVRQHALRTLEDDDRQAAQEAVAGEVLAVVERGATQLFGPDDLEWLGRLDRMHADVRASLEWAAAHHADELLERLVAAAGLMWFLVWGAREGQPWVERALATATEPRRRAELLVAASLLGLRRGDREVARTCAATAAEMARDLGDDRLLGNALHALAQPDKYGADTDRARSALREAVEVRRGVGDLAGTAMSLGALADIDTNEGRLDEAAAGYDAGLPLMRASGSARGLLAYLHSMAECELLRGDLDRAGALVEEGRELAYQTGDGWHLALLSLVAASVARDAGAPRDEQRRLARAALDTALAQTDPVVVLDVIDHVAGFLLDGGEAGTAARLLRATDLVRRQRDVPTSTPRQSRHDRDLATAAGAVSGPAVDVDDYAWLVATAVDALR